MVLAVPGGLGGVGLAEKRRGDQPADAVSRSPAMVELHRGVQADAVLANVRQHRAVRRLRHSGAGLLLLTGRICLRASAVSRPRHIVCPLPWHADGSADRYRHPAVHSDADRGVGRHALGDDRARVVRQRVRYLPDAPVLSNASRRSRGSRNPGRLLAVADLLADPVAPCQARRDGARRAHLGQRLERFSVAAADDSAQQPGHTDTRPGSAAGGVRRALAGHHGGFDAHYGAAGDHLRVCAAFLRPWYRGDRNEWLTVASLSFEQATRCYPGADRPALDGLDLFVDDGEFVVLVGPSGCGKTTSLRMVAGLETVDAGCVRIGDRDVTNVDPKDRDVAMVFQNYALYPHMTVAQNMGFALKIAKTPKAEIHERVLDAAKLLDLQPYLDRKPKDLSGGQRQRVAMGRAIVRRPQVFLMDEPLSNLDAKLRVQTRNQIAALQRRLKTTTVYVTHDQVEAMTMGDRVAVLRDGLLQQFAAPRDLYKNPDNVFVAGFIGSPAMNLFTLPIVDSSVSLGDWPIRLPREIADAASEVVVGVRPEHFELGGHGVEMEIDVVEELGADAYLYGRIADAGTVIAQNIVARADGRNPPQKGSRVRLHPEPGHLHFFGVDGSRIS